MSNTARNALVVGVATVCGVVLGFSGVRGMYPIFTLLIVVGLGIYIFRMLSGNQRENQATLAEHAAALMPPPVMGMGNLYVCRDGFVGRAMGIDVQLDGVFFAQLKSPRFTMVQIAAGAHTLAAGPRGFAATQSHAAATEFAIQSGETVVFRLELAMGALKNKVLIVRENAPASALAKLATVKMTSPLHTSASE